MVRGLVSPFFSGSSHYPAGEYIKADDDIVFCLLSFSMVIDLTCLTGFLLILKSLNVSVSIYIQD